MAKARGGAARQAIISGREFDPANESSPTIILSGVTKENMATGNGSMHTNSNRKLGGVDDLSLSLDGSRNDLEYLQELANGDEDFSLSVTLANGNTYSGTGQFEGEINFASNDGTISLAFRAKVFEQI